jgi:hypothetical protein
MNTHFVQALRLHSIVASALLMPVGVLAQSPSSPTADVFATNSPSSSSCQTDWAKGQAAVVNQFNADKARCHQIGLSGGNNSQCYQVAQATYDQRSKALLNVRSTCQGQAPRLQAQEPTMDPLKPDTPKLDPRTVTPPPPPAPKQPMQVHVNVNGASGGTGYTSQYNPGKTLLMKMTGSVRTNDGTTITVTLDAGKVVGQTVSGDITKSKGPKRYSKAEGQLTSQTTFVINTLWDRSGTLVPLQRPLTVSMTPAQ